MPRKTTLALIAVSLILICGGCAERALKEVSGAALGAQGKVVALPAQPGAAALTNYKSFQIESVSISPDLVAPADLAEVVKTKWAAALHEGEVGPTEFPNAVLKAEIVHYEGASLVDSAAGPMTQIVVHTTLIDATTKQPLRSANLVGRSTAIATGSPDGLADGSSKALLQWLGESGVPVKKTASSYTNLASNPTAAFGSGAGSMGGTPPGAAGATAGAGTGAVAGAAIPAAFAGANAMPGMAAMPNSAAISGMSAWPGAAAMPTGAIPGYPTMPGGMSAANMPNVAMPNPAAFYGQPAMNFPSSMGYPNQQVATGAVGAYGMPNAPGMTAAYPGAMPQIPTAYAGNLPVGMMNPGMQQMSSLPAGMLPGAAAIPGQPGMSLPQGMSFPTQQAAMGAFPATGMPNAAMMSGAIPQNPAAFAGAVPVTMMNPAAQSMSSLPAGYMANPAGMPTNFTAAGIPGQQPGMQLPQGMTLPNPQAAMGALPATGMPNAAMMSGAIPQNPAAFAGNFPAGTMNPAMQSMPTLPAGYMPNQSALPANFNPAAYGQQGMTLPQGMTYPPGIPNTTAMAGVLPQNFASYAGNFPTGAVPGAAGIPANFTNAAFPGQAAAYFPQGMSLPNQAAYAAALQNGAFPNAAGFYNTVPGMIPQYPAAFNNVIPTVAIDPDPAPGAAAAANNIPAAVTGATTPATGGIANQFSPTSAIPGSVQQILPESVSAYAPAVSTAIKNTPTSAQLQDAAKSAVDSAIRVESLPAAQTPPAPPAPQPPASPPVQEVPINN